MTIRQKTSNILKYLIVLSSFGSTILGLFTATNDGYSSWHKRLTYFTTQSNIWIGIIYSILIICSFSKTNEKFKDTLYYCKFYFTVSIAMTGVVFCFFLGPLADQSYHPWSFYSIIAHAVTPLIAVVEFYLDGYEYSFSFRHVIGALIIPLIYYSLAIILCLAKFDFGRGEPYPYFFLDVYSSAGFFGFSNASLQKIGTLWWILIFALVMLVISFVLLKTHRHKKNTH